jgi:hypothetical protein
MKSLGIQVLSNQGLSGPYKRNIANHALFGVVCIQLVIGFPLGGVGPKYKVIDLSIL